MLAVLMPCYLFLSSCIEPPFWRLRFDGLLNQVAQVSLGYYDNASPRMVSIADGERIEFDYGNFRHLETLDDRLLPSFLLKLSSIQFYPSCCDEESSKSPNSPVGYTLALYEIDGSATFLSLTRSNNKTWNFAGVFESGSKYGKHLGAMACCFESTMSDFFDNYESEEEE